jgi:hypothetical protein
LAKYHCKCIKNPVTDSINLGVGHYILWKIGDPITSEEIQVATNQLMTDANALESASYTNPPQLKSILDVDHAHILIHYKIDDVN